MNENKHLDDLILGWCVSWQTTVHTSLSSPCDASSFTLQRDSSCSTLLWRRCSMPSCGHSGNVSPVWTYSTRQLQTMQHKKNPISPSLPRLSYTSHNLSVKPFGLPLLLSASQPIPSKNSICWKPQSKKINPRGIMFNFTSGHIYLRVPWCRGRLNSYILRYCPLKSAKPLLIVLVDRGNEE